MSLINILISMFLYGSYLPGKQMHLNPSDKIPHPDRVIAKLIAFEVATAEHRIRTIPISIKTMTLITNVDPRRIEQLQMEYVQAQLVIRKYKNTVDMHDEMIQMKDEYLKQYERMKK